MALLKVVFSHTRAGRYYPSATHLEVPDSEVEQFLKPNPDLGIPFFVLENSVYTPPAVAPYDPFQEIQDVLEKNQREAMEAEAREDAEREAAKAAAPVEPVAVEEAPVEEPAPVEAEAEAAEEPASEETPKSRRRGRSAE